MPGIVDLPQVVQAATREFADLFACEPQRRHFGEYLTGLMIAERKSVSGINREFAETTDQSCLNRLLTAADWDVAALNERRLKWLQDSQDTRYSQQGVIAIDDVLIDHDGQFIQDVGWFWDHAEQRNKIAHDYLIANDICTSGKHYPLVFRRFKKRDQCAATGETFEDHTVLFCQLIDWVCERNIPGDFTFDSDFSHAENLNHIHSKQDGAGRAAMWETGRPIANWNGRAELSRPTRWPPRFRLKTARNCAAATNASGTSPARCECPDQATAF